MGKIGVIGQGYVGTAIKLGFQDHYDILTYDKFDLGKSTGIICCVLDFESYFAW